MIKSETSKDSLESRNNLNSLQKRNDQINKVALAVKQYINKGKYQDFTHSKLNRSLNSLYAIKLTKAQNTKLEEAINKLKVYAAQYKEIEKDSIKEVNRIKEQLYIDVRLIIEQTVDYEYKDLNKHSKLLNDLIQLQAREYLSTLEKKNILKEIQRINDIYIQHYINRATELTEKTDFKEALKDLNSIMNVTKGLTEAQKKQLDDWINMISETMKTTENHVIKPNETLYSISQKYDVPIEQLIELNKKNKEVIQISKRDTILFHSKVLIIR